MSEKFIQTQNLYSLLEIEPYILLGVLLIVTWLFYRFFLQGATEERHRNIQNHFKNIVRHFVILSLLFFFFLFVQLPLIIPILPVATLPLNHHCLDEDVTQC